MIAGGGSIAVIGGGGGLDAGALAELALAEEPFAPFCCDFPPDELCETAASCFKSGGSGVL